MTGFVDVCVGLDDRFDDRWRCFGGEGGRFGDGDFFGGRCLHSCSLHGCFLLFAQGEADGTDHGIGRLESTVGLLLQQSAHDLRQRVGNASVRRRHEHGFGRPRDMRAQHLE